MWNEHFGISLVEMMAAGLIVVGHRSGGPLRDIVVPYKAALGEGDEEEDEDHAVGQLYVCIYSISFYSLFGVCNYTLYMI